LFVFFDKITDIIEKLIGVPIIVFRFVTFEAYKIFCAELTTTSATYNLLVDNLFQLVRFLFVCIFRYVFNGVRVVRSRTFIRV